MTVLDKAVTKNDDGSWDFTCPGVQSSPCGANGIPFASTGWPTRKAATARGREHFDEHLGNGPMSTLEDFRRRHNIGVNDDGTTVSREDL